MVHLMTEISTTTTFMESGNISGRTGINIRGAGLITKWMGQTGFLNEVMEEFIRERIRMDRSMAMGSISGRMGLSMLVNG